MEINLPTALPRLAVQRHAGLASFHPDQTCGYAPLSTGKRCGTPLGHFLARGNSCAQGPRLQRHHALVHQWRLLLTPAGYHVQLEQEILIPNNGTKWADLVARHTDGTIFSLDVLITGSPGLRQPIDPHLRRTEDLLLLAVFRWSPTWWSQIPSPCTCFWCSFHAQCCA